MLFFKLYNWIKYKTLPSSFLFKNRLFVERDSKHRRIVNNFGLVFRSSKWSLYENTNVSLDFKNIFFKFFFLFLFLFFLSYILINFNSLNNYFFNSLSFFFWFTIDTFDYYLSFIVWSFLSFISLTVTKLYFFINNYNYNSKFLNSSKNLADLTNLNNLNNLNNIFLSQNDLNWVTYSWLTCNNNNNNETNEIIEMLFDSTISKNKWFENYNFFFNLYKTVFFLNLNKNNFFNYNNLQKNLIFTDFAPVYNFFNDTRILNHYFKLISSFYFKSSKNNRHYYLKNQKNKKWSLDFIFLENFKNNLLVKSKNGHFFFNNLFYFNLIKKINSNNFFFSQNLLIKNNLNYSLIFSKWNRWLYRYSLLHRKSIKFTQKLTFTKKLINSGFYNSSIFKKNLWNSVYFNSKKLNDLQITTLFDSYFNNFFKINNISFFNKKFNKDFNLLNDNNFFFFFKFFENSYFWHLKRFFIFNNLSNNSSFFKINFKKNNLSNENLNERIFNNLNFNFFLKNRVFFLQPLFISSAIKLKNDPLPLFQNNNLNNFDNYLLTTDLDLLSKDNLYLINNLSNNSFFNFFFIFDSLNTMNFIDFKYNFIKKNNFFGKFFFNHFIFFKNNIFFFNDLFLFNFYFK